MKILGLSNPGSKPGSSARQAGIIPQEQSAAQFKLQASPSLICKKSQCLMESSPILVSAKKEIAKSSASVLLAHIIELIHGVKGMTTDH